jgi:diguanylate cyclase (GGDEF)-like protein
MGESMAHPIPFTPRAWPVALALAALVVGQAGLLWWALTQPLAGPWVLLQCALLAGAVACYAARRAPPAPAADLLALLGEALDILPDNSTFSLFDAQDRLVLLNARCHSLFPRTVAGIVPGMRFEELVRLSVRLEELPEAQRTEAWIQQRLAAYRNPGAPYIQALPNDQWIRHSQRKLSNGSTVILREDITDTVHKERALEQARQQTQLAQSQLYEALEAMPIGMELYDEQDRLVYFNRNIAALRPWFSLEEGRGQTYEALLRIGLAHGFPPEAMGQEETWLATQLALRGKRTAPEVRVYPNDTWMHAYETRTPSGRIVAVRLDITELVRQRQDLQAANHSLAQLSVTDSLTGIANRRHFDDRLASEWQRCARQQEPLALLVIDIDHFKRYNDHYGHLAGDACLRHVAQLLAGTVRRAGELVARYGGEEFVLLLPRSHSGAARVMAEHCMQALALAGIPHANSPTSDVLTLSIGIAHTVPSADSAPASLVQAADVALYRAKNAGRQQFDVSGF